MLYMAKCVTWPKASFRQNSQKQGYPNFDYLRKKIKNRFADHPLLSGPITIVFIKDAVIHHSLFQKIKTELVYILTDYYQVMHSASDLFGKVKPTYLSVRHIL